MRALVLRRNVLSDVEFAIRKKVLHNTSERNIFDEYVIVSRVYSKLKYR